MTGSAPVLVATRRYLDRSPPLRHPRDLADPGHTIVRSGRARTWEFVHAKSGVVVSVAPHASRALVSTKLLAAEIAAHDVGLALVPRTAAHALPKLFIVEPGGYRPTPGPFSPVTPSVRTAAPKVRAFADAMRAFTSPHVPISSADAGRGVPPAPGAGPRIAGRPEGRSPAQKAPVQQPLSQKPGLMSGSE